LPDLAKTLTDAVRASTKLLPDRVLLPHPSPRNQMWLTKNPWFASDVPPLLRQRVRRVLEGPEPSKR